MRIMVAIAHHGTKNRRFLERMVDEFVGMSHDVDIVVLSEAPKDLGDDVEVMVGLPTSNPWSLPFAHRPLFADRRHDYELFIYSEDDTLITQRHIDTFLTLSSEVPEGYLPGFMRYELDDEGGASYSTVHSFYRWDPSSTFAHEGRSYAAFTNEHAACYMLTREQLVRAIDSGGFLVEPHEGQYDMLVSAATDPYTRCGFDKVLCLDLIDDLCVHHMPNVYLGKLGIPEDRFRAQVHAAQRIAAGDLPGEEYLTPETSLPEPFWHKHCFPHAASDLPAILGPPGRLLSLGVGDGATEGALAGLGWDVTVVPIDNVLGAAAAVRGLHVLDPRRLTARPTRTADASFDIVLAVDVLAYLDDPAAELRAARSYLAPGGRVLASVPDHRRYAWRNRLPIGTEVPLPDSFERDGVHRTGRRQLLSWFEAAGMNVTRLQHRQATRRDPIGSHDLRSRLLANSWLADAEVSR